MGPSTLIDDCFAKLFIQKLPASLHLRNSFAQSTAGTPTLGLKVKRKCSLLVGYVRGVHDLGSLGKLWLLFASGGAWNRAGSCDALVSLSLASHAISTQAAAA